jgi:hypothetical protein
MLSVAVMGSHHFFVLLVATLLATLSMVRGQSPLILSNEMKKPVLPTISYMCFESGANHMQEGYEFCSRKLSRVKYAQRKPATTLRKSEGPRASTEWLKKDADMLAHGLEEIYASSYNLCTCAQWHKIAPVNDQEIFSERNGHAVTVFRGMLWLVGGRSKEYKKWDLANSYRRADVWYSYNGKWWVQEEKLFGDFYHQNADVLIPGPVAPWWERFGHSLNTISVMNRTSDDNGTIPEAMVLFGGYAPDPMNDLWISLNGNTWNKVFLPPNSDVWNLNLMNTWPTARAYHGSCIFRDSLWIVGGTPLNNEVWRASDLTVTSKRPAGERVEASRYFTVTWKSYFTRTGLTGTNIPFMPRAGLMLTSQKVLHEKVDAGYNFNPLIEGDDDTLAETYPNYPYEFPEFPHKGNVNHSQEYEYMYVMGGFASWPGEDPRYDGGKRARNDVWRAGGVTLVDDDYTGAATDDATADADVTDGATADDTDDAMDDATAAAATATDDDLELEWTRLDILKEDSFTVTEAGHGGGVYGGEAGAPWPARVFGSLVRRNMLIYALLILLWLLHTPLPENFVFCFLIGDLALRIVPRMGGARCVPHEPHG